MALTISPNTKVTLGISAILTALLACVGFGMKLQSTLTSIDARLEKMNSRQDGFEDLIKDRWTKTGMSEYTLRLQVANPSLHIPDPRDPSKMLSDIFTAGYLATAVAREDEESDHDYLARLLYADLVGS